VQQQRTVLRTADPPVRADLALERVHVALPRDRGHEQQVAGVREPGGSQHVRATAGSVRLQRVDTLGLGALALEQGLALYSRRTSQGKFGDWVMITPPLIIDAAQVDELVDLLARAIAAFERTLSAR
jgi:adenosylmethionine-8-amino-7-oxononanoate aminotransferase